MTYPKIFHFISFFRRGLSKQLQKKHDLVKKRKAKKLARERERKRLQAIKKIMKYKVSGKVYASEEDDKPEIFNGEFHTSQEAASAAWTWIEDLVGGAQWEWSIMHERYGEQEVGNVMQETEDSEPEEDFINYIKKKGEVKIFCEYNPKVVSFVMVERI